MTSRRKYEGKGDYATRRRSNSMNGSSFEPTAGKRRRKHKKQAAQKAPQTATTAQSTARHTASESLFSGPPIRSMLPATLDAKAFDPATPWEILVPLNLSQIDLGKDGICPSELELLITALERHKAFLLDGPQTASIPTQIDILSDTINDLYGRVFEALSVRVDYISAQPGK